MKRLLTILLLTASPVVAQTTAEFIQKDVLEKKLGEQTLKPGTIYYYNYGDRTDNPPTEGNDNGKNFIQIQGCPGNYSTLDKTQAEILRISKVPENPPKTITIGFDSKYTSELTGWEKQPLGNPASIKIRFSKPGQQGGGENIKLQKQKNTGWQHHQITVDVPPGAQFIYFKISARQKETVCLANWTIY